MKTVLKVKIAPLFVAGALVVVNGAACVEAPTERPGDDLVVVDEDPSDNPLRDLPPALERAVAAGDALFEQRFFDAQGLGPLYIRTSCASCHADDGKGPGFVTKTVSR